MADVAVVDYGMGNLHSISSALSEVGAAVTMVSTPEALARFDRVVLPGVGAFGRSMDNLRTAGLDEALSAHVAAGRPLFGVCLGFQVLFEASAELGEHRGLGLVPGHVTRFVTDLHVPHVGWNVVRPSAHPIFSGLGEDPHAYFVHSFRPEAVPDAAAIARSEYGGEFVCAVAHGCAAGVQFHPEKSGPDGLRILSNFMAWRP